MFAFVHLQPRNNNGNMPHGSNMSSAQVLFDDYTAQPVTGASPALCCKHFAKQFRGFVFSSSALRQNTSKYHVTASRCREALTCEHCLCSSGCLVRLSGVASVFHTGLRDAIHGKMPRGASTEAFSFCSFLEDGF